MSNLRQAAQQALEALEGNPISHAGLVNSKRAIVALRDALENEFNPDWDQVVALQEYLREHTAQIQRLRAALAEDALQPVEWLTGCPECGMDGGCDCPSGTWNPPEQEPVAWMYDFLNTDNMEEVIRNWVTQDFSDIDREKGFNVRPLYTAPPQRKPLTGEEIAAIVREAAKGSAIKRDGSTSERIARAIEAHHGIGEKK